MAIVAAIAAGFVAFLMMVAVAYRLGLRDAEAVLGAALTGVLTSLAMGDLFVAGLRHRWTARPMFAGAIGGTVLLGLTVVLVDKVVERSRARQWRRILAQPVSYLLKSVGLGQITEARWAIEKVRWQGPAEDGDEAAWTHRSETQEALRVLDAAAASVTAAVEQIRPELLMGGEDLAGIYRAALRASSAAKHAMLSVAQFRDNVTEADGTLLRLGPPYGESENRARYVTSLWTEVRAAYDALAWALQELQTTAHVDFRSELPAEELSLRIAIPTLDEEEDPVRSGQSSRA